VKVRVEKGASSIVVLDGLLTVMLRAGGDESPQ
jgi:hypothetical protein